MDAVIGGIEIRDPIAIALRLEGLEVGRKAYDGGLPAVWSATLLTFDEVVVECEDSDYAFQAPNGGPIIGTGGDIEIPGYESPWSSIIPLVPKV